MKSIKLSPIDSIPKSKCFAAQEAPEVIHSIKNASDSGLDKSNRIFLEPITGKGDSNNSTSSIIQKNEREGSLESGGYTRHGQLASLPVIEKAAIQIRGSEEMLNQRHAEVERILTSDINGDIANTVKDSLKIEGLPKSNDSSFQSESLLDIGNNEDESCSTISDSGIIDNTIFQSEEMLNHRRATVQRIVAPITDEPNPFPVYPELTRIDIRALVDTIEPIITHPRRAYTPLIIDPTHRVDMFFEYSADYSGLFLDAKKYMIEAFVKKSKTIPQCLQEMKEILLNAMKHGKTFVFHMGDSATNFVTKFNHPDIFPSLDILSESGRKMKLEENYRKLTDDPQFVCRDEFCVVVTTAFQVEDYRDFLCNSLPLDELVAIYIQPATSAPKGFSP
ncbi:hypothetical protein HDV01_003751 [Terramyces sp. JEL0728]|nr:hypothetical protein HDV01_003751 [Terramyces sp. JEL0728]